MVVGVVAVEVSKRNDLSSSTFESHDTHAGTYLTRCRCFVRGRCGFGTTLPGRAGREAGQPLETEGWIINGDLLPG